MSTAGNHIFMECIIRRGINLSLKMIAVVLVVCSFLRADDTQRYGSEIFTHYQYQSDIPYGEVPTDRGAKQILYLDLYTGIGDTMTRRPLMIYIHGGGFVNGDKVSKFGTRLCGGLAKRGYVVASINYRLSHSVESDKEYFAAMIRVVQDAKASIRFFRRNAGRYGIDTSHIFVTGSSAGSTSALHLAYLDSSEMPSYVDMAKIGETYEGSSGNPGYSSEVHGVVSNWGALGDYRWINEGDIPLYCVHGTDDSAIPYDSSFSYHPFKYGSKTLHQRACELGMVTGLRLFTNTGHTLDNNAEKQDSAIQDISAWLVTLLQDGRVQPIHTSPSRRTGE